MTAHRNAARTPPRVVYFNGAAWLVDRPHARARVFIWRRQGLPPRPGQTWRCVWAAR